MEGMGTLVRLIWKREDKGWGKLLRNDVVELELLKMFVTPAELVNISVNWMCARILGKQERNI